MMDDPRSPGNAELTLWRAAPRPQRAVPQFIYERPARLEHPSHGGPTSTCLPRSHARPCLRPMAACRGSGPEDGPLRRDGRRRVPMDGWHCIVATFRVSLDVAPKHWGSGTCSSIMSTARRSRSSRAFHTTVRLGLAPMPAGHRGRALVSIVLATMPSKSLRRGAMATRRVGGASRSGARCMAWPPDGGSTNHERAIGNRVVRLVPHPRNKIPPPREATTKAQYMWRPDNQTTVPAQPCF